MRTLLYILMPIFAVIHILMVYATWLSKGLSWLNDTYLDYWINATKYDLPPRE
jgi:hypothetical protein